MKTIKFLTGNYANLTELRQEYYKLCLVHHPDKPTGNTANQQQLNNEFEYLSAQVLNGEFYSKYSTEGKQNEVNISEALQEIINNLIKINLVACFVEVCGGWLWVSGNTRPIKDDLKQIGFKFSVKKCSWYWHEEGYKKRTRKVFDMDSIRKLWGSSPVLINPVNQLV